MGPHDSWHMRIPGGALPAPRPHLEVPRARRRAIEPLSQRLSRARCCWGRARCSCGGSGIRDAGGGSHRLAGSCAVGGKVTLTASVPVRDDTGTVTQEIVQTIDPTKVKLTAASDIVAPAGWTVSYSTDGTNFTATAPASETGWAAVRAVKATGAVVTQGADSGKQVATGSAATAVPPTGTFNANFSPGDPFMVAFDETGRVFAMTHHDAMHLSHEPGGRVKCFNRDGTTCAGWTGLAGGVFGTKLVSNYRAYLWMDTARKRIWFPTNNTTQAGFGCIDVPVGAAPSLCSASSLGTTTAGFVPFVTCANSGVAGSPCRQPAYTPNRQGEVTGLVAIGSRIFTQSFVTGAVFCLDLSAPTPVKCSGASYVNGISSAAGFANADGGFMNGMIPAFGNLIVLGVGSASVPRISCIVPSTGALCSGWSTSTGSMPAASIWATDLMVLPSASGSAVAVCATTLNYTPRTMRCFTSGGQLMPSTPGRRVHWWP